MNDLNSKHRIATRNVVALALAACFAPAQAQGWTSIGAAGVISPKGAEVAELGPNTVSIRPGAPAAASLFLRYDIGAVPGFTGPGRYVWRVSLRDNGSASRVQLYLRRFDLATGTTTHLASFDSNQYPAAATYQLRQKCIEVDWQGGTAAHYIYATLLRTDATGTPAIAGIQLEPGVCVT